MYYLYTSKNASPRMYLHLPLSLSKSKYLQIFEGKLHKNIQEQQYTHINHIIYR